MNDDTSSLYETKPVGRPNLFALNIDLINAEYEND